MVRKCLNGTATNNVDFGITTKEGPGICGDEQTHGRSYSQSAFEGAMHNGIIRIEGRNDGGCEQRSTKDFAKFSCLNSKQ